MLIMSSRVLFAYVFVLIFLLLGVKVDSETCGLSSYQEEPLKLTKGVGQNATEGQWPWMVAIRMRGSTGHYYPSCSGFLIDKRHVISAAHCYGRKDEDLYRARIGNINQNIADEYHITGIEIPAGHKQKMFYDDIAVLTLDREVNFPNFNPICLPNEQVSKMNLNGREAILSVWGTEKHRGEFKNYLKYLPHLPVLSNSECQRKLNQVLLGTFRRQFPSGISTGFICAAFKEGYTKVCPVGGGPLMIQSENKWYAVGVASFGFRCGIPGMPEGFTRIANYVDWIKQTARN